jgi:UbiA prenyltransferase family protein
MSPWIAAARLRTLPAAVVPVVVGTACVAAVGSIAWGPAVAALAGALAIQIGTNFANDVFDHERGADGPDRVGPLRAVAAGLISAAVMKRAMIAAFGVATASLERPLPADERIATSTRADVALPAPVGRGCRPPCCRRRTVARRCDVADAARRHASRRPDDR